MNHTHFLEQLDQTQSFFMADEATCVQTLLDILHLSDQQRERILLRAKDMVKQVRNAPAAGSLDAFLGEYDLSSQEGVVLMCLAEALLRIPDADTADALISDKLMQGDWHAHRGESDSLFVNASTWGLLLTGKFVDPDPLAVDNPRNFMQRLASRLGEPVVRAAMKQAMKMMGKQFVMGETIAQALKRSQKGHRANYRYSFDMLGEAAMTYDDAEQYFESYQAAIAAVGASNQGEIAQAGSVSVKLSALHPRYDEFQETRVLNELAPKLQQLVREAQAANCALTIDAEESERLQLSLKLFAKAMEAAPQWGGLGLALQAYQKRAFYVIDALADLARTHDTQIPIRLVKGAYWDSEIKHAQVEGWQDYPVFTRKLWTDISYLACAKKMLAAGEVFYPQFATHNAYSVSAIIELAGEDQAYEFQRLHGMGAPLYEQIIQPESWHKPCRVYAPVGAHRDLLPYLVRRLLENGANTSFVNRIADDALPLEEVVRDPFVLAEQTQGVSHPNIPLPANIYGDVRTNSSGINLYGPELSELQTALQQAKTQTWEAKPSIEIQTGDWHEVTNPNNGQVVGKAYQVDANAADVAMQAAHKAQINWNALGGQARAECLLKAAEVFAKHEAELIYLCIHEAGKTLPDAIGEVREAIDFLRFYAVEAKQAFGELTKLTGPTGESNRWGLRGRGVFVAISPWNFPLAIFTGQITAALAAGNSVIAKPAEQTPLVAALAVHLLHEAGIPKDVLVMLPGKGSVLGSALVAHPLAAGVVFTGSTQVAQLINRMLAGKDGPIVPLIAETGGQNAMVVDSSALLEQVVADAVQSAFNSAGQRCSALRVLMVQDDVADELMRLLKGHMQTLVLGDSGDLATDVGPVIDAGALAGLNEHKDRIKQTGKLIYECELTSEQTARYCAPLSVEIDNMDVLTDEVFGPVLHVLRFKANDLEQVVKQVNQTGFGLTFGLHSRIDRRADWFAQQIQAGNIYVNRNIVGAVVGVQPFGGCGLSGTGPKAGGPLYLQRFACEVSVSVNTTAMGGNASLLSYPQG